MAGDAGQLKKKLCNTARSATAAKGLFITLKGYIIGVNMHPYIKRRFKGIFRRLKACLFVPYKTYGQAHKGTI